MKTMAMHRVKCCRSSQLIFRTCVLSSAPASTTSARQTTGGGYYVLLPETPPDSAEDNAVMQFEKTPQFSLISPVRCISGCAKLAIEYETILHEHIENVRDTSAAGVTFSGLFDPIEEISVPLSTAWRTSKHLNFVSGADYAKAFIRIHPQVEKAKNERWSNSVLYRASQDLQAAKDTQLDDFQRRLVSLQLTKGRLNGVELKGEEKRRFADTHKVLAQECANFRHRVMASQAMFSHRVEDFSVVVEMPIKVLKTMAEYPSEPSRGPWHVTLQPHIYTAFLEHCSDRTLRWNAWNAYNNRASVNFNDRNLANHKLIEELRQYRRDMADMLGYENFAEMSIETKMAGSVEKVLDMISTLKQTFWSRASQEIAELQKFAASEGFREQLQPWDVAYWRRRQRQHLYAIDHRLVAEYFPLDSVLTGLFQLCRRLFKVRIEEHTGQVETWHEDVRYFQLYNVHSDDENDDHNNDINTHSHQLLGSFFFDPFSRPGVKVRGSWTELGAERSGRMDTTPLSYLVLNLDKPSSSSLSSSSRSSLLSPSSSSSSSSQSSLLSSLSSPSVLLQFGDVVSLFHQMGQCLQQLLSRVPYSDLSGQNSMEQDALQVCGNFMERWALDPAVLGSVSCHKATGQPLPQDLTDRLLQDHRHMMAYDGVKQLYLSAFDMEIYLTQTHWHRVMRETWEDYLPLPLSEDDNHPCSLTHVFSDSHPASYYSFLWSQVIAADMFAAFREKSRRRQSPDNDNYNNNTEQQQRRLHKTGMRFKDTVLSLGAGLPAEEVFRRFRARDPSLDALLQEQRVS